MEPQDAVPTACVTMTLCGDQAFLVSTAPSPILCQTLTTHRVSGIQ